MIDVWCLLVVDGYVLFDARCWLHILASCSLFAVCCLVFVVCCLVCILCWWLLGVCCVLFVVCLCAVCWCLSGACCFLLVDCGLLSGVVVMIVVSCLLVALL